MKTILLLVFASLPVFSFSCANGQTRSVKPLDKPIVILFDNDVHCGRDADGYAQISGLKAAICAADTAQCLMVSSGDYLQGGVIGSLSRGKDIVTIMNRCGYDAVCLGNHEFDYGMDRLFELTGELNIPVTCCNMTKVNETEPVFDKFIMVTTSSGTKIAFVGILTPEAYYAEHVSFIDNNHNQIYEVSENHAFFVQTAVNQARDSGADFVIALSHLGEEDGEWSSRTMIAATSGIDAVLDGHSHSVINGELYPNKDGKMIPRSQTGTKFKNIGKLYISKQGDIVSDLIPLIDVTQPNPSVSSVVDSIKQANSAFLNEIIGHSEFNLTIYDRNGRRIVRRNECTAGNFVADAFRYVGGGEIAITNGGGIRTDIPAGNITLHHIMDMVPFGNNTVTAKIIGSDILKILQNESEGAQNGKECGGFPVVSGMKYVIEKTGTERVKASKVMIWDKDTKCYKPLDLNRTYTVSSHSYFFNSLDYVKIETTEKFPVIEYEAVEKYLQDGLKGIIGPEYKSTQGRITFE